MADTHKTTEALIAEYRADADKMDAHELPQPTTQYLRIMLDRLEAANRRERGDCAKLREALEELVANIEMRSSTFELNVMVDTKTYLDAKAALDTTSD